MYLAIILLDTTEDTTGRRRGELIRLTVGDYDPLQRTLAIRESKLHKSRLVPVSADTAREVERLIEIRGRRRLPAGADSPLLWNRGPRQVRLTTTKRAGRQPRRVTAAASGAGSAPHVG